MHGPLQNRSKAPEHTRRRGVCRDDTGEQGGTLYRRSPESLVVRQANDDILEHVSTDELVTRIQEMRERPPSISPNSVSIP